ncbi:MAG TPA: methyltransferase domain-containing protein [Acidimicrobiales bacterium]|nr:methyltransferase domain-containing protein [Acidimicrobiales bacterium]
MTFTYGAVDESPDPQQAVIWQERLNERPAIRAYKQHTYELVADARLVLDVGCGPGTDAAHLGRNRVVGLDPSSVMCRQAAQRGVTVCRGDALALPFADEVFDACRCDRVMQHLTDPSAAVDELLRVTRPGGRIVVSDPDQESLVLHVPGVPRTFTDRVKRLRRDVGYRNGRLASELPEIFASRRVTDIAVAAFPLVITDPGDAFGLPSWPRLWRDRGIGAWDDDELSRWDQAIDTSRTSGFVYALMYLVVSGTRP